MCTSASVHTGTELYYSKASFVTHGHTSRLIARTRGGPPSFPGAGFFPGASSARLPGTAGHLYPDTAPCRARAHSKTAMSHPFAMSATRELPVLELSDRAAWERWLDANHAAAPGAWLKLAKKDSATRTVTQAEAIEEAVCFGWIDGQVRRYDEHFFLQRFTPRRPRSKWSAINRERARRLIADGRMKPAGLREYDAAKADGRLEDAYPAQSRATVPEDFQTALDRHPPARAFFETLTGSDRYAFLYRLHQVRDPRRRAQRIANYIELLSERRTLARR